MLLHICLVICNYINSRLNNKVQNFPIRQWCGGKIAALLQAFGLSVGLCGLANVLQMYLGY
jgi:hypothetical protein